MKHLSQNSRNLNQDYNLGSAEAVVIATNRGSREPQIATTVLTGLSFIRKDHLRDLRRQGDKDRHTLNWNDRNRNESNFGVGGA
jgi:hypothetical protein